MNHHLTQFGGGYFLGQAAANKINHQMNYRVAENITNQSRHSANVQFQGQIAESLRNFAPFEKPKGWSLMA